MKGGANGKHKNRALESVRRSPPTSRAIDSSEVVGGQDVGVVHKSLTIEDLKAVRDRGLLQNGVACVNTWKMWIQEGR